MGALLSPIQELAQPLIDHLLAALPFLVAAVAVLALMAYGYTQLHNAVLRLRQRRLDYKETGGEHSWNRPDTWFKLHPVEYLVIKGEILANEGIIELYAASVKFIRKLKEKEKARKEAWRSPFPEAVKRAIAESNVPDGSKLDARKQIKKAALQVQVRDLPEGVYVGTRKKKKKVAIKEDEPTEAQLKKIRRAEERERIAEEKHKRANHFRIDLGYVGKDPAVIEKVEGRLVTQLGLKDIRRFDDGDPAHLSFVAHREKVIDPLTESTINVEWLNEHKATNPYALPLAIKRDGTPLVYNMHHGMCGGASGTGKGSFIQAMIWQLADQVEKGLVELWFIDPKWSEAKLYERNPSSLFKHISVGMDEEAMRRHAETIHKLKTLIARRIAKDNTSIEEGNVQDGRDFDATRQDPMIVVFIDEYPTLYSGLNLLGKDGKAPQAELLQIVATGRSLGVFVEGATQKFDKTILEAVRDNIANWWLLGQDSAYYNDLFLGEGARDAGFDTTAIPRSSKATGYHTAGIGYAKDESGAPVAFRLPFINKEDMGSLIRRFRALDGLPTKPIVYNDESGDDGEFTITETQEEDELPDLELIDFDESSGF